MPEGSALLDGLPARLARAKQQASRGGRFYLVVRWSGAALFMAVATALVVSLVQQAWPAFAHSGFAFLWSGAWDPVHARFGAGVFIVGTLLTTIIALVLAVPVGIGAAALLSDLAPRWLAGPLAVAIDLIAAVPSIVVGLWGLLVLSPLFEHHVEPDLQHVPLLSWLCHGFPVGSSLLLAGVVLAIMILPTVVALSRSAMQAVATTDREAARALGATRWQVVRRAVVPEARSGIEAAVTLGVGRAFGETIAVAMVIGNRYSVPHSLLAPASTLGSAIINQFGEANTPLEVSSVFALVVVLFGLTALVNAAGQLLLRSRSAYQVRP